VYPFEGKLIDIIEVPEQERPFFLRKNFGKLTKDTVYYRQGTSTAIADPDEVRRMGAAESAKKHEAERQRDETEQVKLQLGLLGARGMYADVLNTGKVPVYVKQIAISVRKFDNTKQAPFNESTVSIPFSAPAGSQNADIDPRREVRFVLPLYPSAFLEPFTKDVDSLSLTVETYTGVIHTEPGPRVMHVLTPFVEMAKRQEERAKPINVKFCKPVGAVSSEHGSAIVIRTQDGFKIAQKPTIQGFQLTEDQLGEVGNAVASDQVCGTIGDYEWRVD
jgi:hypothetical protein